MAKASASREPFPLADAGVRTAFRRRLLSWFDVSKRDLPWRTNRDPYAIWISEIMLQQTQVATVIPYFARFLERFPNAAALAVADEQDVLRAWEGLGYYRRARHLHQAAKRLVSDFEGILPQDADQVRALPGFGRYTANAVLSQAFDAKLPILEANTRRVISRLVGIEADLKTRDAEAQLWHWAEQLLPSNRVGDFNQSLMELGALVCKPEQPRCEECPAREACFANLNHAQDRIPARTARPALTEVREVALVIRRGDKVLLVQRPLGGRWGSMWEFPRTVVEGDIEMAASKLLAEIGIDAALGQELVVIRHGVTRFRIRLACIEAAWTAGDLAPGSYVEGRWLDPASLEGYPVSRPQRRLADLVRTRQTPHLF